MQKIPSRHNIWLGRTREVAELEAGLDALGSGRGSLFLLTGEPGIGKTRLADEIARRAAARGMSVHWGRAWEAGGAPAYWPVLQALRTMATDVAALDGLVAPSTTPIERFELFERVDGFLRAAAVEPRVVVLDDLHAADPSSLQLLHFIVRHLRERPLMVVGTYREAEARLHAELRSLLARLAREACVLPLVPLDREEVAEFVVRATGDVATPERVDDLYAQTEGNPLFLRELLHLASAPRRSEGIREVIQARLALIPQTSLAALEAAAVLGREFEATSLAAVANVSELEARALLEPAAHAGIVEALDDPPRWRFTHVLLRQGLYDELDPTRRAALHGAAAAWLRRRPHPALFEIAHHMAHAMPNVSPIDAAHAAARAADHAMDVLAFEDALAFYQRAEQLLEGVAGERRSLAEALLGGGLACMRMAQVDRGRLLCGRAAELARALGDGELFARAVLGAGYEHAPWTRDPVAIARLEEALAMLPAGDGPLRARCVAQLAGERQPEPDLRPLLELAREAVAMARRIGDPDTLRTTLSAASFAMVSCTEATDKLDVLQESLRSALAAGDKRSALRAHAFFGGVLVERGDTQAAEPHVVAVESLLAEFRHGRFDWLAAIARAIDALSRGRFAAADRYYRDAEASLAGDEARGALMAARPISVACVTECYDDVAVLESRTRAAFGALGYPLAVSIAELFVAQLHGRMGDTRRAVAQLQVVKADPLLPGIAEAAWLAMLTDACCAAADTELAARLHRVLLPHVDLFAWLGPIGACMDLPYARHVGLLAATLGRLDEAVGRLEQAEALVVRAETRAHLARVRWELARVLLARDAAGDRDRAAALVADARAIATELGQTGLLRRIEPSTEPEPEPEPTRVGATPPRFGLQREGDYWVVAWGKQTIRLRDGRGLQLLAQLVDNAGCELHVLQLAAPSTAAIDRGDAGPVLDEEALRSYRGRLLELRDALEEAEGMADMARTDRLREEMDLLSGQLAAAVGLGGRQRRTGQAAERARTAVQKRLREAIRRIEHELPELGLHLHRSIRTGTFCGYFPEGRRR